MWTFTCIGFHLGPSLRSDSAEPSLEGPPTLRIETQKESNEQNKEPSHKLGARGKG